VNCRWECFSVAMAIFALDISVETIDKGYDTPLVEIFAILRFYAVHTAGSLPTFRDNLSVPSSRVHRSENSWAASPMKMGADRLSRNVGTQTTVRCVKF